MFDSIASILDTPNLPNRPTNQSSLWHVSDTEELFHENYQKYSDSLHLNDFLKNPIIYNYNNYGFRTSDNFNLKEYGNVFLGCSHTFGIGHHLENVWSYKLSQKIGGRFYNISEPGNGVFTQYRYLHYFKDKIKFKNVFHFLPPECLGRYEFINSDGEFNQIRPEEVLNEKMLDFMYSKNQLTFINYVYINAIRYLLNNLGVNYYLLTDGYLQGEGTNPYHDSLSPARDLIHYYVEEHQEICESFYKKYKLNLSDNSESIKKII